jgi:hypothetical protein
MMQFSLVGIGDPARTLGKIVLTVRRPGCFASALLCWRRCPKWALLVTMNAIGSCRPGLGFGRYRGDADARKGADAVARGVTSLSTGPRRTAHRRGAHVHRSALGPPRRLAAGDVRALRLSSPRLGKRCAGSAGVAGESSLRTSVPRCFCRSLVDQARRRSTSWRRPGCSDGFQPPPPAASRWVRNHISMRYATSTTSR